MARNAIKSDFQSSKMAADHFVNKLCIDLKCREMRSKVIFGHPKWGGGGGHHNGQPVHHSGIYTVFALTVTSQCDMSGVGNITLFCWPLGKYTYSSLT